MSDVTREAVASDHPDSSALIKTAAERLGFELCGITSATSPSGFQQLQQWLDQGLDGTMHYIGGRSAAYAHPRSVLAGVRSLIVLGINYATREPSSTGTGDGRVSRYAWGARDYHHVIRDKLHGLADVLHQQWPGCRTRGVVDTAPLLERDFARLAGLGWFGKNTMLINKHMGSWLFLAAVLTDLELAADEPHHASHCGTCRLCLDACPTDAFVEPYVLDAGKCISYLTIELRNQPVPSPLRPGMGDWIFGCDICQDVCPWNRRAPRSACDDFQPRDDLHPLDAVALLRLDAESFAERFRDSPLLRPGRSGMLRNAAIVLGNSRDRQFVSALETALSDADPIVRGAVAWALGQLGGRQAVMALKQRLLQEKNQDVCREIESAVAGISHSNSEE